MDFIILLKPKLYHLDNILPLLFELKKAEILTTSIFVAPNKKTFDIIRKNFLLFEGIQRVGGRLTYINRFSSYLLRNLYNLFILRKYFYCKIVSIDTSVNYSGATDFLSSFNQKFWGGKRILSQIRNWPAWRDLMCSLGIDMLLGEERKEKILNANVYDYAFLSHSREELYKSSKIFLSPDTLDVNVGYTRGLAEWSKFLEMKVDRFLSDIGNKTYFFYNIGSHGISWPGSKVKTVDIIRQECLLVLKEYNESILTVFKPHPNTKIEEVKDLLADIDYKNYIISYTHPHVLLRNARFLLCHGPSTLHTDAYYMGCPTLEYTHYDPRLLKMTGGESTASYFVDFFINNDAAKLREALEELICGNNKTHRPSKTLNKDFQVFSHEAICSQLSNL